MTQIQPLQSKRMLGTVVVDLAVTAQVPGEVTVNRPLSRYRLAAVPARSICAMVSQAVGLPLGL